LFLHNRIIFVYITLLVGIHNKKREQSTSLTHSEVLGITYQS